jgi:hypothetical protein
VVADQPARELIKIAAKVVSHGRYVTFHMAEVAVPRQIFAEILFADRLAAGDATLYLKRRTMTAESVLDGPRSSPEKREEKRCRCSRAAIRRCG